MTTSAPYDHSFYQEQFEGSLGSARVLTAHLAGRHIPASVVDVGCGRGAWLAAWAEQGVPRLLGIDGPWNEQQAMAHAAIEFRAANLEQPLALPERFDLAMSIEVVEHLSPAAGEAVVQTLAGLADAVVFSAAVPGQGGVNHIHERYPSHWAGLFAAHGFRPYDAFRPHFWTDERVMPWHRANVFLYARDGHPLARAGYMPIADAGFMDAVHPWLYDRLRLRESGVRDHLRALGPSLVRALRRRL